MVMDNRPIETAIDLWNEFQRLAKFQDTDYDADLEKQIRQDLSFPADISMATLIKEHNISVVKLLSALTNSLQPFSQMMSDLLAMFEQASAQKSNVNLQIKFDFDANTHSFSFNLDEFRRKIRSISTRVNKEMRYVLDSPWSMIRIFRKNWIHKEMIPIKDPEIARWLHEYKQDIWPSYMPHQPLTHIDELDNLVKLFWDWTDKALEKYRAIFVPECGRRESILNAFHENNKNNKFFLDETDRWTFSFIESVTFCIEEINSMPVERKTQEANCLKEKIVEFLKSLPRKQFTVQEEIDTLVDILNLPFWKRRYELYSAWVLTQVTKAFKDTGIKFHVTDNTLSFSFKATHMATCTKLEPPLEIWSECRTELANPIGKGRKRHIQPDYTLAIGDATIPENSVAVVECKQYKRASNRNFLDAICDYAMGRPFASVFLVDYGSLSGNLLYAVDPVIAHRSFAYGQVQPNTEAAQIFQQELRNRVVLYYQSVARINPQFLFPWKDNNPNCIVRLQWSDMPRDLDIHLFAESETCKNHIYYADKGCIDQFPFAELDEDCQDGNGCESISIKLQTDTTYRVIIDNYSKDEDLDGCIQVCVSNGSDYFLCTTSQLWIRNQAWEICQLSKAGAKIINRFIPIERYF